MTAYSQLLRLCRERGNLTQKEFVLQLSLFSKHFKDLNPVTLSRWETGVTSPSLEKKKTLLQYILKHGDLDDDVCYNHIVDMLKSLVIPLREKLNRQCEEIVGTLPVFKVDYDQYNFISLEYYSDLKLSYIVDIELANHPDHYYKLELSRLREWSAHKSSLCLGCELDGEHVGHIMLLKVSLDLAQKVIQNEQSVFSITSDDLLSLEEDGTYLVHTIFGINTEIVAMLSVKAMLFLLEQRKKITNIAALIMRKDDKTLSMFYGSRVVAQGFDKTYGYKWYGTLTPFSEILFSNTVVKMIF